MANWFGKSKKGLIFGIWNSHTSLGNILGSLIAGNQVTHFYGSLKNSSKCLTIFLNFFFFKLNHEVKNNFDILGAFVEDDWGLSFMVPGMIIGAAGFIIWLFMVPKPTWVGLEDESSVSIHLIFILGLLLSSILAESILS